MRTRIELARFIEANWTEIVTRARMPHALESLPKAESLHLFGSSVKVEKGRAQGIETAVMYMAPHTEAFDENTVVERDSIGIARIAPDRRTMCPVATDECFSTCLGAHAGRMIQEAVKNARLWRTALYMGARDTWRELAIVEAKAFAARATRNGFQPAIRVDGSTDCGEGARLAQRIPEAQFYDYTKIIARVVTHARSGAPNYHLTFSASGQNDADCLRALFEGVNVAMVLDVKRGQPIPSSVNLGGIEWPTIDGDEHDARFLDPDGGHIVALRFKAAADRLGSIQRAGSFAHQVEAHQDA